MKNYPLHVVSSSRRLILVTGLLLIGVVFLFPTRPVEMHARSAMPEATLAGRQQQVIYVESHPIGIGWFFPYLYIANLDGSGRIFLGYIGAGLSWSSDGSKLVTVESYPTDIVVRNPDGTNPIDLTNTPGIAEGYPSWSVTGKIAYERDSQIWTMNSDGSNQALFAAITQPTPTRPAWSPDGSQLAFASGGEIWLINADGTNERRLTTPSSNPASDPAWSPDGLKLAFVRGTYLLDAGLYVINTDGTNNRLVTSGNQNGKPTWTSDGTKIVFLLRVGPIDAGIYVVNADGTNRYRTISSGYYIADMALQPFPPTRPKFDFDGDNKDDFALYRAGSSPTAQSYWDILRSSNNTRLRIQFGSGEDKIVPADYNGDGKTDIAVFRPSNGFWYITTDFGTNYSAIHWGSDGDIPLPGDFDGDGKADLCVFRPSEGVWYIRYSSDGSFVGHQFGTSTDKPLLIDYDGDRKTDLAFLRTAGTDYYWFILQSSNNTAVVPRFGIVGDKAVPADYDGDGRSNLAVYRPETGKWIILAADGTTSVEYQWGVSGDMPTLGNFDADGITDLTIFRPDTAVWYVARSSGSPIIQQWGRGTDLPVQAAYIP